LRVAFLVSHFPKLSETFVLNQVTGLLDRGHEVDIYSEGEGDWEKVHPDVVRYQLHRRTFRFQSVPDNYFLRSLKGAWLLSSRFPKAPLALLQALDLPQHGWYAGGLRLLYAAASLADSGRCDYDIIHCQFGTQGYQGVAFQKLLGKPKLVVMFRGHDISSFVSQNGENAYASLLQTADFCLANCDFFRQRVIALGCPPERIAVHRSGLDPHKFPFRVRNWSEGGTVEIATIGRLVEKKGIAYAIEAVARHASNYNLVFRIIGDGELRPALERLITELGVESNVRLVGWKNEREIVELLERTHLFIAPSVTAADGNQDAPINTLKEAMAMGLPVLSTEHGGIPELVEDGVSGYLVPERDPEALASRLGDLLAEPERWEAMGRAGRAFVERHYNIHKLNDRLVTFYESLLGVGPPPAEDWPSAALFPSRSSSARSTATVGTNSTETHD